MFCLTFASRRVFKLGVVGVVGVWKYFACRRWCKTRTMFLSCSAGKCRLTLGVIISPKHRRMFPSSPVTTYIRAKGSIFSSMLNGLDDLGVVYLNTLAASTGTDLLGDGCRSYRSYLMNVLALPTIKIRKQYPALNVTYSYHIMPLHRCRCGIAYHACFFEQVSAGGIFRAFAS